MFSLSFLNKYLGYLGQFRTIPDLHPSHPFTLHTILTKSPYPGDSHHPKRPLPMMAQPDSREGSLITACSRSLAAALLLDQEKDFWTSSWLRYVEMLLVCLLVLEHLHWTNEKPRKIDPSQRPGPSLQRVSDAVSHLFYRPVRPSLPRLVPHTS